MARKDLLKKAFRNNFIRKSVADLKSLTIDRSPAKHRHVSSTSLRSHFQDVAPVIPPPRTSTPDFPAHEQTTVTDESDPHASASSPPPKRVPTGQDPNEVAQWVDSVGPKDDVVRIASPELHRHEKNVLENGNPMTMSPSQVRQVMEKADAHHKVKIRSAHLLRGHNQLVSDCHDLFVSTEEMVASHLDTIDTTLAILEAFDEMSPYLEGLKQEMVEKKVMCENQLIDLLPVQSRLEHARAGKGYA
ncbi:hypothetical protein BU23DRAFT_567260 [Bimuria novae-zelandiae CBS 107.79]|uniref:Uncharacterized protein n=1 Tax=Bimuria novae-zelandiae CBS 107.79 TaxID=1447943 RepID=A0A6A5VG88_9PLEO|nr:hypothetical protein BU23DRAFT_567260 [Bimuria novae-zelandiae CBS 107.79]